MKVKSISAIKIASFTFPRKNFFIKDTHREKILSIKLQNTKTMNMNICIIGTANQLLIRGS